jgi:2-polyprenyl-3-methyl-5-hydroxy-6-metoxy-1,4-benzoquinol methylase
LRARKLNELAHLLPSRAHVLDIGCGAGVPVARDLIARGFKVTGVDASARQIERARCNVPQAHFIRADMTTIEFLPSPSMQWRHSISITHIPA